MKDLAITIMNTTKDWTSIVTMARPHNQLWTKSTGVASARMPPPEVKRHKIDKRVKIHIRKCNFQKKILWISEISMSLTCDLFHCHRHLWSAPKAMILQWEWRICTSKFANCYFAVGENSKLQFPRESRIERNCRPCKTMLGLLHDATATPCLCHS